MPLLKLETNVSLTYNQKLQINQLFSQKVASLLNKSESHMLVILRDNLSMTFGGNPLPTLFIQLKSIGMNPEKAKELIQYLGDLAKEVLFIEPERTYIDCQNIQANLWGWNKQAL